MTNNPVGPLEMVDLAWLNSIGIRQMSDVKLNVATATVTFSVLNTGYSHLLLMWRARSAVASTSDPVMMRIAQGGSIISTASYMYQDAAGAAGAASAAETLLGTSCRVGLAAGSTGSATFAAGQGLVLIPNYRSVNQFPLWVVPNGAWWNSTTGTGRAYISGGSYVGGTAGAVSQVQFLLNSGSNFAVGSRFTVYGVT